MTQPSPPGGSHAQPESGQQPGSGHLPGSGQLPAANAQPLMTAAQPSGAAVPAVPAGPQVPVAAARGGGRLRQFAWASVPVWSIGFLAFAPFLRLAIARRGKKDWAVFAGYLAAVVMEIVAVSVTGRNGAWSTATGGLVILLMGGGAVHSFVAFGGDPGPAAASGPATFEQLNREALATARG